MEYYYYYLYIIPTRVHGLRSKSAYKTKLGEEQKTRANTNRHSYES